MRHAWLSFFAALIASGCGGKVLPTAAPDDPTPADCAFGNIAEISGVPISLASAAGGVYFVLPVDQITNRLYFTSRGEQSRLVTTDDVDPDLVVLGSSVGFIRRELDTSGRTKFADVEISDAEQNVSIVDGTSDTVYQVNQLSTNGTAISWLRWFNGSPPTSAGGLGEFRDGVISYSNVGADVTNVYDVFPDSSGYFYAGFVTVANHAAVIGLLPTNGASSVTLASAGSTEEPGRVLGVDGDNVIYDTIGGDENDVWSVPKTGGPATKLASARGHIEQVVLYSHHVFWTQGTNDSTAIMSFDIRGDATPRAVATRPRIETFTVDACGVVYAAADTTQSATTIYRSNYHSR